MLRTIYVYLGTIVYFLISLVYHLPRVILSGEEKGKRLARKYGKRWGKFAFDSTGSKVEVIIKDQEDFDKLQDETIVVVSNHQSNFDIPLLLGYFPKNIGFVAKKEMESWPVIGMWMKKTMCVFMDRSSARKGIESMKEAIKTIQEGYSVVIFPEGTRSESGEIDEFKKGSFKLASDPGVKIVPVTIVNTKDMMVKNSKLVNKVENVKLIIEKSIDTASMERAEKKELSERVQSIVQDNYDRYLQKC